MSKLATGIGIVGEPATYVLDMRDEVITDMTQFVDAIYRFRANHTEEIGWIRLSPTQEYCLKVDCLKSVYNVKEDRPYTIGELGALEQFMGYRVVIGEDE